MISIASILLGFAAIILWTVAVVPSIWMSWFLALIPMIVSIQDASAVAQRSVGEKASPLPWLSVGASVIIIFPD